jgi:putative hydrolase of the HAD superfamily
MFEDIPRNLEAPHALGMTTVLVRSNAIHDHPVQQMIRTWVEPPEHVHHMTFDLAAFLEGISGSKHGSDGVVVNSQPVADGGLTPPQTETRGPRE